MTKSQVRHAARLMVLVYTPVRIKLTPTATVYYNHLAKVHGCRLTHYKNRYTIQRS